MDRGEVPCFPRAQNPGRATKEQGGSWEHFVPESHWDQRLGYWLGTWIVGADQGARLVTNFRCPLHSPLLQLVLGYFWGTVGLQGRYMESSALTNLLTVQRRKPRPRMGQEASSSSRSLPSRFILVSSSPGILPPDSLLFSYLSHSVISLSSYEVLSSTTEKVPQGPGLLTTGTPVSRSGPGT